MSIKDLSLGTSVIIREEIRRNPSFKDYFEKLMATKDPSKTIFIEMQKVRQNVLHNKFANDKNVYRWIYLRSLVEKEKRNAKRGMSGFGQTVYFTQEIIDFVKAQPHYQDWVKDPNREIWSSDVWRTKGDKFQFVEVDPSTGERKYLIGVQVGPSTYFSGVYRMPPSPEWVEEHKTSSSAASSITAAVSAVTDAAKKTEENKTTSTESIWQRVADLAKKEEEYNKTQAEKLTVDESKALGVEKEKIAGTKMKYVKYAGIATLIGLPLIMLMAIIAKRR